MNTILFWKKHTAITFWCLLLYSNFTFAQSGIFDIPGGNNTTGGITRWGNIGLGIGSTVNPNYPLHILTGNSTGIKLINQNGGAGNTIGIDFITYNPGGNYDHKTARIECVDMGSYNSSLVFYTRPTNTSGSQVVSERMRINDAGNVGIGTSSPKAQLSLGGSVTNMKLALFDDASGTNRYGLGISGNCLRFYVGNTASRYAFFDSDVASPNELLTIQGTGLVGIGTNAPSRLLHIKSTTAGTSLFLDGSGSYSNSQVEYGAGGTALYSSGVVYFPACGSQQFRLGLTSGTGKKAINMRDNQIFFSDVPQFGACSAVGLSGRYLFDDQVSSASLLVGTPSLTPYLTLPTGYLFSVKGPSNFQYSTSNAVGPNTAITGINVYDSTTYSWIQSSNKPIALNPIPNPNPTTTNTSYVAIGFRPGTYNVPVGYKLAVKGKIICEELKVKYAGLWSDYVFDNSYKLRTLSEVENYVSENKHLPDVPSEAEIKENGIESGQMDATLLRKIEELTLYMIEMNKEIGALKKSNEVLKEKNSTLEKMISK